MNPWVELWTSMWVDWLGQGLSWQVRVQRRGETSARLPEAETAIIPLHRHADSPSRQARKIAMRLEIPSPPWGGGNVIALDAAVLRSQRKGCSPGDGGPDRGR